MVVSPFHGNETQNCDESEEKRWMAEASSKSAKKNAKRRSKSKSDSGKSTFTIEEDIGHEAPPQATPTATPTKPPCDPIAELKKQIEEAKAVKDHKRAQELRQQMWVMQDKAALDTSGYRPGTPEFSAILDHFTSPSDAPEVNLESMPDPTEKKVAKLRKKLEAIESLKERRDRGEKLEANQLAKIEKEGELLEEIEILNEVHKHFNLR